MITFSFSKITQLILIVSLFAIVVTSCKKNTEATPIVYGDAKITVTNTVATSNPQDFYQDDIKLSTNAISYGQTSFISKLKAGSSTLYFKNEGSSTVTASLPASLETNIAYTSFYYLNPVGKGLVTGFADDQVSPALGKFKVRFVNLGPVLANPIYVGVKNGSAINGSLGFESATGYLTLDIGTALEVKVINSLTVISPSTSTFVSGKIYTVWFDGDEKFTAKVHVIQQN